MGARFKTFSRAMFGSIFATILLMVSVASAQTTSQTRYGDWVLACYEPGQDDQQPAGCTLSHAVLADGRLQLLALAFGYDATSKSYPVQIKVPLSTSLPLGLNLGTDGTGVANLRFTRCDARGCYVEQQLAEELVTSLATGKPAVAFADRTGQPIRIEFSNVGLENGLAELKASQTPALAWLWEWLASLIADAEENITADDPSAAAELPDEATETDDMVDEVGQ